MIPFNDHFTSVWVITFATRRLPGEAPSPIAVAAQDVVNGTLVEIGIPRLRSVRHAPYPTGPQCLLVTVDAELIVACHLELDWRVPERILDLMVEHRNSLGGASASPVGGLAGALVRYGLPAATALIAGISPKQMRQRLSILVKLFVEMSPSLDLGRALLRGRYLCAAAQIGIAGVPVDGDLIEKMAADWPAIFRKIVDIVDAPYGVHRNGRLDETALAVWFDRNGIVWPTQTSGRLDLGDSAFRDMARSHPETRPIKELRATLLSFDPTQIAVGQDRRNRTPLRPFASRSGRNQPSAKASILGSAAWVRHLIRPAAGKGLALIDWAQQEFGIAAALSGDVAMMAAYDSGDPYLALAVGAGAAPSDATSKSHADVRARFKTCVLGMQYGMGTPTLARLIGASEAVARELQRGHRAAYPQFWRWSDQVEIHGVLSGRISSAFGWTMEVAQGANRRAIRNFPLQANGAEMLRLACCLATETGITVCAPNHDSLLIEAPLPDLHDAIITVQRLMAEASAVVLDGYALRSSVRSVGWPDRWREEKGRVVWEAVIRALGLDGLPAHRRYGT